MAVRGFLPPPCGSWRLAWPESFPTEPSCLLHWREAVQSAIFFPLRVKPIVAQLSICYLGSLNSARVLRIGPQGLPRAEHVLTECGSWCPHGLQKGRQRSFNALNELQCALLCSGFGQASLSPVDARGLQADDHRWKYQARLPGKAGHCVLI